ncbi:MAG: ABC transporter substrate-binding protein [Bacteroidetes bacterium]|nr:MAG: ABC transporter substrate-binding protein [Bacteroidota bacterium]
MKLLNIQIPAFSVFIILAICIPEVGALQKIKKSEIVKIGLLIPDNKSVAAKNGAEMAIRKANENGGLNGRPFQLVVRSMEGPWGTGSKQAVDLIFDEEVWALVGSHDGRNAHLVEQVATKARIVFLSAWASDPTLSQAFVPWYFSCVPNDLQQSNTLIEEIYNKRKFNKIATLSDSSYDSNLARKSFIKKTKSAGKKDPLQFFCDNTSQDFNNLLDQVNKKDIDCIILFGQPSSSAKFIEQMRIKKINIPVFGSLALLDENQLSDQKLKNFEGVVFVSSGFWLSPEYSTFRDEYQRTYTKMPGAVSAYAFDGVTSIIKAIRNAGTDRDKILKSLKEIKFDGVTGKIRFDDKGNRLGASGLMEIENGIQVPVER